MTAVTVAMKAARKPRKRPAALLVTCIVVLGVMVMSAILAPLIAPYDPDQTNLMNTLAPPSPEHIFGTDNTGRDTFSRVLFGARLSLLAPLVVVMLTTIVGTILGLVAARAGGVVDIFLSRAMDMVFAFPALLLALLAVAIFGPGIVAPVCALAIAYIPFVGRLVRSAAQQEQAKPYVGSHAVMGFGSLSITLRHILPNIAPMLLAQATLAFGYAMLDLAAMSYLGLGVQPPSADWGAMISASQGAVLQGNLWSILFPSLAVILTVLSVNVIGESLSDRFSGKGRSAR